MGVVRNDVCDPAFDGVGIAGFKSRALWPNLLFLPPIIFSFCSFYGLVVWGWGIDRVFSLSPDLAPLTQFL